MKVLFTICGRAGSKGIKNKNIKEFVGIPLPYYTLSAIDLYLKGSNNIEYDIVINSDSIELLDMMKNNDLREVELIDRSARLAGDMVGKIDVIRNCLSEMEKRKNVTYDVIVDLDITSPLRTVKDIERLVHVHFEKKADVTTSVVPARRNPYFNQVTRMGKGVQRVIASDYTARQQAPNIYDMNASLYAYSPSFLRTEKGILDGYCEIIEMMDTGVLDLDHENDFELMEVIAHYLFGKYKEFGDIRDNLCQNME